MVGQKEIFFSNLSGLLLKNREQGSSPNPCMEISASIEYSVLNA